MAFPEEIEEIVRNVYGDQAQLIFSALDRWSHDFGRPILPDRGGSAAVAFARHKTAALFYDRVWTGVRDDVPAEIRLFGATEIEQRSMAIGLLQVTHEALPAEIRTRAIREFRKIEQQLLDPYRDMRNRLTRTFASSISRQHKVNVVPVYDSAIARDREYAAGDVSVLVAAISNLEIVDDDRLTWEQVLQVRSDAEGRANLRRLTHWLDASFVGKSGQFIEDEIGIRLERYTRTLKKHGIQTVLGSVAATLDSQFVLGGAAAVSATAYLRDPTAALAVGAAILIGKVAVHVAQSLLDLETVRFGDDSEVAFVAELKKL